MDPELTCSAGDQMTRNHEHSLGSGAGAVLNPKFWLVLGIVVVVVQCCAYPFIARTHYDEGSYSFLGYNAVTGVYRIYEHGGPYFAHMPLTYLVPGVIHAVFGKQFYVYRLFCAFCVGLLVFCAYQLAKNLAGQYAALITLWILAGSVYSLTLYCVGGPLSFTAMFLVVSLLILASDIAPPYREIGAIFCITVALAARRNLAICWLFIVLYAVLTTKRHFWRIILIFSACMFLGMFYYPFFPEVLDVLFYHQQLPGFLGKLMIKDLPVDNAIRFSLPLRAYIGSVYYLFRYYHLILISVGLVAIAGILRLGLGRNLWRATKGNPVLALVWVIFVTNVVVHMSGGLLGVTPFAIYNYFDYFAPLGAVIGGVGIVSLLHHLKAPFSRGILVGAFAVTTFLSLFPWYPSPSWGLSFSVLSDMNRAAQSLATLTRPEDKIFSVAHMHEFHLAGRRPYFPGLVRPEWSFVVSKDSKALKKYYRYNYAVAKQWLKEANVLVVSDAVLDDLSHHFQGYDGSGQEVANLVRETARKDFTLIGEIPNSSRGTLSIYRRANLAQN
jgi:hypothetical protein